MDREDADLFRIFEHFLDFQSINQSGRHRILQLLNDIMVNRRKGGSFTFNLQQC